MEVTNTLANPYPSGIRRVTQEIFSTWSDVKGDFVITPITYCSYCKLWRRLSSAEYENLLSPGVTKNTKIIPYLKKILGANLSNIAIQAVQAHRKHRHIPCDAKLVFKKFEVNSVFLDIENSWFSPVDRAVLQSQLKSDGVRVALIHYDIAPFVFPQFFLPQSIEKFKNHFLTHALNNSLFICISRCAQTMLEQYARTELRLTLRTEAIVLGANFRTENVMPLMHKNSYGQYLLSVGTVEPRKNYAALLDAFDLLLQRDIDVNLVIVGREGWLAAEIIRRIKQHSLYKKRLYWLDNASDAELAGLYENAYAVVVPSLFEGLGLPVIEALQHGCLTASSNAGGLPEAGGAFVDYFPPGEPSMLANLIERYCLDQDFAYHRRTLVKTYQAPSWQATCEQINFVLHRNID